MMHKARQTAKFKKLIRFLRPHIDCVSIDCETIVVGLLERLWHMAITSAPSGDIGRLDNDDIAEMCGWFGEADLLIESLVKSGWVDKSETHRLVIHDWHEHCPGWLRGNLKNSNTDFASWASESGTKEDRTKSPTKSRTKSGTKSPTKSGTNSAVLSSPPLPYLTLPKENITAQSPESGSELQQGTGVVYPLQKGGETWELPQELLESLQTDFPGVDVLALCREARAWCEANKPKRKTANGMPRFLTNWVTKANNSGQAPLRASGAPPPPPSESIAERLERMRREGVGA